MEPTTEQKEIIDAARNSKDSLLISALAGSAKTTTLEMICNKLPVQPILSLAFNKKIAVEMEKRLPGHVKCQTLNSLGHGVWAKATGKRLVVNTKKTYEIVKGVIDELPKQSSKAAYEVFAETIRAVDHAKLAGYVPEGKFLSARRLLGRDELAETWEEDIDPRLVDAALTRSIAAAYDGAVDFNDQIYMPSLFGGTFPKFPLVMVDEAQDLSPLNHAMLEKLVTNRIIAVGDERQSIYGFRGADTSSMGNLRKRFSCRQLGLSVSFRCPQAIVERARRHAPHMQWAKPGGEVEWREPWSHGGIPDGSAIICRNNAPLFSLALALIRNGRGVKLVGSDIGPQLVRTLKRLGDSSLTQKETLNAIDKWEAARLAKSKSKGSVADKADCLRVFAGFGSNLGSAISYAEHLFASAGPIQLLSGHKSKGLEWETVYHLDSWRIPSAYAATQAELEQEANLDYVITTRSKSRLVYVNMEGFNAATH